MLKVNEIFYSIQGESSYAGFPCIFIRLTGCNLNCTYCDTRYAFKKGRNMTIENILKSVNRFECPLVEITGGEPLLQTETSRLAQMLSDSGYRVFVETNGTQNIDRLPVNVSCIMDIKCPGSGEEKKTDWANIHRLDRNDEVKFVLTSRADYLWATEIIRGYRLTEKVPILFSPVLGKLDPAEIARWILEDGLDVRLQLQIHKIIWPDETRSR